MAMIKSVTVINFRGESLKMELANPYDTGFAITSITGIGPVKANINTTELATSDGAVFNSARATSRNIVFSIRLLEDSETKMIEDTRQKTYKYFPLKKMLTLIFETDNRIATIQGYVESNEPDIFSSEESVQISIVCPSPYFYSDDEKLILNGVEPAFYFPFSNESVEDDLIMFGEIKGYMSKEYFYNGDVDSGMIIHIHTSNNVGNISVFNISTDERMNLDTSKIGLVTKDGYNDLIKGDDVYISTISGDRYVTLLRATKEYNILSAVSKITDWLTVIKGSNIFGFLAEYGGRDVSIEIYTNILFEGV